jgi:hypothetical protein
MPVTRWGNVAFEVLGFSVKRWLGLVRNTNHQIEYRGISKLGLKPAWRYTSSWWLLFRRGPQALRLWLLWNYSPRSGIDGSAATTTFGSMFRMLRIRGYYLRRSCRVKYWLLYRKLYHWLCLDNSQGCGISPSVSRDRTGCNYLE